MAEIILDVKDGVLGHRKKPEKNPEEILKEIIELLEGELDGNDNVGKQRLFSKIA